jgi:Domain of unknown function (DUF222)
MKVPVVAPDGWTRTEITEGLHEIEFVRRRLDAASALLIGGLGTSGRDTAAAVTRATGSSARAGRDQARVADVVSKVAGAGAALESGEVSVEHLRSLGPVADTPDAAELLPLAATQTPEEFDNTVKQFQLDRDEAGVRERQQRARSVKYFDAEHGCFGIRGVFTPLEGAEIRGRLQQIADAAWRAAHPDRAETLGGHGAPPRHQRLADAFLSLVREAAGIASSKPSIVIVVNEETLQAEIAGSGPGSGPISLVDVALVAERANLYAAVKSMKGEVLNFGRSRRFASSIQRLALITRDGGKCVVKGCNADQFGCVAHHVVEDQYGGLTNVSVLVLICKPHHAYLHANRLRLIRDGTDWRLEPEPKWADTG